MAPPAPTFTSAAVLPAEPASSWADPGPADFNTSLFRIGIPGRILASTTALTKNAMIESDITITFSLKASHS